MYSDEQIAKVLGCTVSQLRDQHAKNAVQLFGMLNKAVETGRKVNGFTVDQLRVMYAKAQAKAYGGSK